MKVILFIVLALYVISMMLALCDCFLSIRILFSSFVYVIYQYRVNGQTLS